MLFLFFARMRRPSRFCKSAIGGHEAREHRRDQLDRVGDGISIVSREYLRIGHEIAMHDGRQFKRKLDRFVIG
jgi:hypothetical protein